MLKIGIVGLPNSGKSTLFNALTKQRVDAKNFPFTTIEPNVGIVAVPDNRLDYLADIFKPEKTTPAAVEFVDIAGLIKGAAKGEGLGNKFLSHIREVDAIVHVVRAFSDTSILHVEGKTDPMRDIETIETELELADLEHPDAPKLSDKPVIYALNTDSIDQEIEDLIAKLRSSKNTLGIALNAKLEDELNELSQSEREKMSAELGLGEEGLKKLIRASYELLGLISFFTAGPKEVRAWTVNKNASAPVAAGKIHTDMQRGFIAAEVINFEEFKNYNSFEEARQAGRIRTEGKEYIVQDGDIVVFRFNV